MADERRKGPADRRRGRSPKPAQTGEQSATPTHGIPEENDPNDAARFDAEQLDQSIRERQQEDRGEVF
ncbi:MAG: hypothetical protein ACT4PJ_14380 [Gemmatimonadaceae bacterium]